MSRIDVRKTYKLFIGGAFPRSESGYTYEALDAQGRFVANVAKASRKDARDAVAAARKAADGWAGKTAYNRGQILYRIAEMLQERHGQFTDQVALSEGLTPARARAQVDAAIDRWVWYAGWTDKLAAVAGGANPVSGPYFDFSLPEPAGVVVVFAPQDSSLLGLTSVIAPVITAGNTCVVVSSYARPLPAASLAEVLATSDVPGGVVNILTGDATPIAPWLASHTGVNGIDLTGIDDAELSTELEASAAGNLKRVRRGPAEDFDADPGLGRMLDFLEIKTVWHPLGV